MEPSLGIDPVLDNGQHRRVILARAMAPAVGDDEMIPACVRARAAERAFEVAWRNELGGVTFAIGEGDDRCFLKWAPAGTRVDLEHECVRLGWARNYTRVPEVIDRGIDDEGMWFVTRALPGESGVAARWIASPARAVVAIGAGLRVFHDALPVETCPFSWSIEDRLADIHNRAARGEIRPATWHAEHRHLDLAEALARLADTPPIAELVVCHGDTCSPNTLVGDDGVCSGHVDLGALGVADRWADLAIATWSTRRNYGPGWEDALLAAYGIAADDTRIAYYRLLWDLGP